MIGTQLLALLGLVLAIALAPASACAGVEIATETTFSGASGSRVRSGKMLLQSDRLRMELPGEDAADGRGLTMIFRGDRDVVYVLDEKDRSYTQMDRQSAEGMRAKIEGAKREMEAQMGKLPPEQRKAMEKMLADRGFGNDAVPPLPEIRTIATEQRDEVGGFACREYDLFEGKKKVGDACIADWETTGTTRADFDALRAFAAFEAEMSKAMAFGGPRRSGNGMTRLFDLGGVPVRMRSERDGKVVSETRLVAIEKRDVAEDAFAPPTGWTKRSAGAP